MACSVLILTYDEVINIAECIGSLPWRDDVHVLDSQSVDGTRARAEALGATVHLRAFTNYADQRNFGLALPFRHDWVVMLDADERMTPELAAEIDALLANPAQDLAMARVRRKDMFMGRWLRRSSGYPTWFARLIRRGRVQVERDVNEEYAADGAIASLSGHILHYPFNKGLSWWFERHNRYASGEARLMLAGGGAGGLRPRQVLSRDPALRRAALKRLAYSMPGRPFLIFLYLFIVRGGFMDGAAGYQYACMRLAYELMIDAKVAGLRYAARQANVSPAPDL